MAKSVIGRSVFFAIVIACMSAASAQSTSSLPDVVGIRPGISAQEAYSLLKARNANIKIGAGQAQVPGLGDKPIVTSISAEVLDARAPEILTVWLTLPPAKQVVYAVGRRLQYDQDKLLLRENVLVNLRQKYGQEAGFAGKFVWVYDHQGKSVNGAALRFNNYCLGAAPGNLIIESPSAATYLSNTLLAQRPQPESACNSYIGVQVLLTNGSPDPAYTSGIDMLLIDYGLSRQAQVAYQDYLSNAANAKSKEELEKAKQRKGPIF